MEEKTRICNKMVIFYCIIVDYISSFTQSKLVKNGTPGGICRKRDEDAAIRWRAIGYTCRKKNTADANASAVW